MAIKSFLISVHNKDINYIIEFSLILNSSCPKATGTRINLSKCLLDSDFCFSNSLCIAFKVKI